jgi:hypothetical protein
MGKSIEELNEEAKADKPAEATPAPTTTESSAPESVPQEPKTETAPPANA